MKKQYTMPLTTIFLAASPSMVVGSGQMNQNSACSKENFQIVEDDEL